MSPDAKRFLWLLTGIGAVGIAYTVGKRQGRMLSACARAANATIPTNANPTLVGPSTATAVALTPGAMTQAVPTGGAMTLLAPSGGAIVSVASQNGGGTLTPAANTQSLTFNVTAADVLSIVWTAATGGPQQTTTLTITIT